ncbi:alpha carbonic anhydrase 7-like [Panicum miliaceum]|uniref:Alpha carbonic anhydrase 7-like n=1 Tax=Panicum miliaceum TaxID=4540 RepID=A0A3L6PCL4_PANMI|nr:alpha carbonic anhydrase 7-like [Panicum miliaceum]
MPAMVSPRLAIGLLVAASSLAAALSTCIDGARGTAYGYEPGTPTGPENWGKLSPEYSLCGEGKQQSPIDIVTKEVVPKPDLESLDRTFSPANATLVNDGHDISLKFKPGTVGNLTVGGKAYDFEKLHWHAPSAHTVNGQRFPLELHLVHRSADGGVAVIAILYKVGGADSLYPQLRPKLEVMAADKCNFAQQESRVEAGLVRMPRSVQRRAGSYFRYTGSLTAPPCTENVVWSVLARVRQITKEQLDQLTAPLPRGAAGDARPVQPLNGRTVEFLNVTDSIISFPM